jgi:hypothetical protein
MNKLTLKALKGSIAKWEAIVAGTGKDEGSRNCPLCKRFSDLGCTKRSEQCPVKIKTGYGNCLGTPYYDTLDIKRDERELAFLRSLLPEDEK